MGEGGKQYSQGARRGVFGGRGDGKGEAGVGKLM